MVRTDTPQVAAARRANLQAIMDDHRALCATCVRQDTCALRDLASTFNLADAPWPLARAGALGRRLPAAARQQQVHQVHALRGHLREGAALRGVGLHGGGAVHEDHRARQPAHRRGRVRPCGQCITHCPTGALTARDDVSLIMEAILDPAVETVVQVAPAVRTAWGEGLGLSREEATPGRLAAALHAVGFDQASSTPTSPPTSPLWKRAASSWNSSAPTRRAPCSRAAVPAGCAS